MQRTLLALIVARLVTGTAHAASSLHVDGKWIRDGAGGVVVLRGVNAAGNSKVPPFRPLTGASQFDPLAHWGMNVVRLLFTWEAYEPSPGVYDESYLDYYAHAVDGAASRGLHVIVDFHQDAFSRFQVTGCGEGFPEWAIPWWVIKSTPDNGPRCSTWGAQMLFDIPMHMAWASFHGDAIGARTRYLAMIERVAARLATRDAVIGYDMMNEPWGDEPTELRRLYEDAAVALRRRHPSAILFVSPHALISGGGRSNLARPSFGNFVYSPHFYDGLVITLKIWFGGFPDGPFANMRGVADAWGVPLFVGEFGADAATQGVAAYITALYDGLDQTVAGGAQWVFTPGWTPALEDGWNAEDLSIFDDAGETRPNFQPRPYPRRISGTPTRFSFDAATETVSLSWDHVAATGVTEIFVPAEALFGTPDLDLEPLGEALSCSASGNLVHCSSTVSGPKLVHVRPLLP
jgi:endoglycosylceramidase